MQAGRQINNFTAVDSKTFTIMGRRGLCHATEANYLAAESHVVVAPVENE